MSAPFYERRTGNRPVYMIGYGSLHGPQRVVSIELLRPTIGEATGGIWHYLADGQRVFKALPALNNRFAVWVAADPTNPNRWMVLLNSVSITQSFTVSSTVVRTSDGLVSPLWLTEDAGATWQSVTLTELTASFMFISRVEFDPSSAGRWFAAALRGDQVIGGVWHGTGTTSGAPIVAGEVLLDPRNLIAGISGDVMLLPAGEHAWHGWLPGVATQLKRLGNPRANLSGDRQFGGQAVVAVSQFTDQGQLFSTTNYRGPSLQKIGVDPFSGVHKTGYGGWVCMLADGNAYLGGRGGGAQLGDGGVLLLSHPTDPQNAVPSIVAGTEGIETGFIRSDRQSGTKWAVCLPHSTDVLVQSGGVVQRVTGPDGVAFGTLADRVEVIVRAGGS